MSDATDFFKRPAASADEQARIDAVVAAIGAPQGDDYKLEPSRHAQELATKDPLVRPLADALGADAPLQGVADSFREDDAEAMRQQWRYRTYGQIAAAMMFAPIAFGALPVLVEGFLPEEKDLTPIAQNSFLALQFLALVFSLGLTLFLRTSHTYERWMSARARAEQARVDYFRRVFEMKIPEPPGAAPSLLLKLEYFRRFHLDVQRTYFRRTSARIQRDAKRRRVARWWNTALLLGAAPPMGLALYAVFSGNLAISLGEATEATFVSLGLVAAGVGNWLFVLSMLDVRRGDAERYLMNAETLDEQAGAPLARTRLAALRSDFLVVNQLVNQVDFCISAEHKAWLSLKETRPRLDVALIEEMPGLAELRRG